MGTVNLSTLNLSAPGSDAGRVQELEFTFEDAMRQGFEAGIQQFETVILALLASYMFEMGLWAMMLYFGWGDEARYKLQRWNTRLKAFRFLVLLALFTRTYFMVI